MSSSSSSSTYSIPLLVGRTLNVLALTLAVALVALAIAPNAWMIARSFWDAGPSLAHLRAGFASPERLQTLLLHSALVSAVTVAVAMGIGLPMGWLCWRSDAPARRWVIAVTVGVAALPVYIVVTAWMAALGSGWWFTLEFWWQRALGAAWMQGLVFAPVAMLLCGLGLRRSDPDLEDLARCDAGPWRVFWRVTLPLTARWLVGAAVVVWLLAFMDITATDLLRVRTYPEEIFTAFLQLEPWPAATLSLPLVAIACLAAVAIVYWDARRGDSETPGSHRLPHPTQLRGGGRLLAVLAMLGVGALYVWPFISLVRRTKSPQQFLVTVQDTLPELLYSLSVALPTATAATFAGIWLALALARSSRGRTLLAIGLAILLTTPSAVTGVGLIRLFNHNGWPGAIYDSRAIVMIAGLSRCLGFVTLVLLPAMRQVPADQLAEARIDGADWLQRLRHIVLPATWRAIMVAWLVGFVLTLGELGATMLVVRAGPTTVAVRLATLIHNGVYPDVAGLCLLILLAVILPLLLIAAALGRFLGRRWD